MGCRDQANYIVSMDTTLLASPFAWVVMTFDYVLLWDYTIKGTCELDTISLYPSIR